MNKELEALLLSAAKALDMGVVRVNDERAHDWGVPVGRLVHAGEVIPGHSTKAKIAVHGHVIEALKTILPLVRNPDLDWNDIADEFIIALGGRVVPLSREDYDFLITKFRDQSAALERLRQ